MSLTQDISFPVFRFASPGCSALPYRTDDFCTSATPAVLTGWRTLSSYFLVDSLGRKVTLRNPRFVKPIGAIGRIKSVILGTRYPVEWDSLDDGVVSVEYIRGLLFEDFERNEDVWSAYEIDVLKAGIQSAKSPRDLLRVFGV